MYEKVSKLINEKIRPSLMLHGGDIELVDVKDNVVKIRLKGACSGCPMSQLTFVALVEKTIKENMPEIKAVEVV